VPLQSVTVLIALLESILMFQVPRRVLIAKRVSILKLQMLPQVINAYHVKLENFLQLQVLQVLKHV